MLKNTKYYSYYVKIIKKYKRKSVKGYKELHHIIPRCCGGSDKKYNICALPAKAHYICHHLLLYIYSDEKDKYLGLVKAFYLMSHQRNRFISSKFFNKIREEFAASMSYLMTKNNPQRDTVWICNTKTGDSIKLNKALPLPIGYIYGRKIKKNIEPHLLNSTEYTFCIDFIKSNQNKILRSRRYFSKQIRLDYYKCLLKLYRHFGNDFEALKNQVRLKTSRDVIFRRFRTYLGYKQK